MRVLFIGGTGQISLPCTARAVAAGHEVTVLNRGRTEVQMPPGVRQVVGDMGAEGLFDALPAGDFDVVCQFRAFRPEEVARDIAALRGRVGQYVFVSSASAYQKPPRHYVITERTPLENPYWSYSRDKIDCEDLLHAATDFPWTIVRPGHTMRVGLPTLFNEGDLVGSRMMAGQPVIVSGDGQTPWTLTRPIDFAVPFVGLFGRPAALGEAFHITGDRGFAWDDIYAVMAELLGRRADIVHVPGETLVRYNPDWRGPLFGDKLWPALFDNSKVKAVAGDFTCAADLPTILEEPVANFRTRHAAGLSLDAGLSALMDRIAAEQRALGS